MDAESRFARWYDLDQGSYNDDLPFYLSLAQRTGSPILELGCGTGRLVLALARAGHQVTGVDFAPAMLDRARSKVQQAEAQVAHRIELVEANFCHLALERRFFLAILAVNTLMHVADPGQQAQVLQRAFEHLLPGGVLALDLFHPHPASLSPAEGEVVLDRVLIDPETGQQVLKFVARSVDYAQQRIDATFIYDRLDDQGSIERTTETFPMRYLHRSEAERLLESVGFLVEQVWGSYDLDPYQDEGERLLFLARRSQEKGGAEHNTV